MPAQPQIMSPGAKQSPAWRGHFRSQFVKTRLCRFYPTGMCKFGDDCAYAHTEEELSEGPDLTKTSMCKAWQDGHCDVPTDQCPYAHGQSELRVTAAFVSKKLSRRTRDANAKEDGGETSTENGTEPGSPVGSVSRRFTGFSVSSGPSSPVTPGTSPYMGCSHPELPQGLAESQAQQAFVESPKRNPARAQQTVRAQHPCISPGKNKPVLSLSSILVDGEASSSPHSPMASFSPKRDSSHQTVYFQSLMGLPFEGISQSPLHSHHAARLPRAVHVAASHAGTPSFAPATASAPGIFSKPEPSSPAKSSMPPGFFSAKTAVPRGPGAAPGLSPPIAPPGVHEVPIGSPKRSLRVPLHLEAGGCPRTCLVMGSPDAHDEDGFLFGADEFGAEVGSILLAAKRTNMPLRVHVPSMDLIA